VKYSKEHDLVLNYKLLRKTDFLNHDVFNKYNSELDFTRYAYKLCNKD